MTAEADQQSKGESGKKGIFVLGMLAGYLSILIVVAIRSFVTPAQIPSPPPGLIGRQVRLVGCGVTDAQERVRRAVHAAFVRVFDLNNPRIPTQAQTQELKRLGDEAWKAQADGTSMLVGDGDVLHEIYRLHRLRDEKGLNSLPAVSVQFIAPGALARVLNDRTFTGDGLALHALQIKVISGPGINQTGWINYDCVRFEE